MRRSDEGMTLIELLISISLLGVIVAGIVTAMLLVFDTVDSTRQKVTDTSGAQLLVSWLTTDAQSADTIQPTTSCNSGALLEMQWTDAASLSTVYDAAYVIESSGNGNSELSRYSYTVSSGACTQQSKTVIVRAVDPTGTTEICRNATGNVTCNDNALQVGLHVAAFSKDPHTGNYAPYAFDVLGARRTK